MSAYVLTAVLPQVLAHLPDGVDWPDGLVVTADGTTVPLVYEPIEQGEFVSRIAYYVGYLGGEPAFYLTPSKFRRLVQRGVAWIVARRLEHVAPEGGDGAAVIAPLAEAAP